MKKLVYIAFAVVTLCACSKQLDQEPSTSTSTSTAITSVADIDYAINGAYYLATGGDQMTLTAELAIYADELGPDSKVDKGSGQYAQKIHERSITNNDSFNAYYYIYKALANVNKAIKVAETLNEEGVESRIAELYGMRGLFHFELAKLFAPIPTSNNTSNTNGIVLSQDVYPLDYKAGRATLDNTYKAIVDDLTECINSGENKDKVVGHVNYWAAKAIRARVNLYWGKYDDALADAVDVIENSPYKLYTIDNYVSAWTKHDPDEAIMQYVTTTDYNAQRYAPGYYTSPDGYTEYLVTDEFYEFMKADPKDVRSNMVAELTSADGSFTGKFPTKYPGKEGAQIPMYDNNIKVCRLSEMYLIAAEVWVKKGTPASGKKYLDQLRENRIEGYDAKSSTNPTIDDIINERRKELFAEGQIAFDYWRNGKSFTSGPAEYKPDNNKNVLPIPKEETDICGDILVQNPGYGR
ncbi:MAG: RagB/SusD family nutrient uptake outer membrane protein [Bacteroidales bacterium]|nr:RagB/SusD family nutrient uptake outer membrane protein [Bacteroidales bacterium]